MQTASTPRPRPRPRPRLRPRPAAYLLALLLVAIVLGLAFSSARSALEAASSHGHSPQPQPPQLASIWASRRNPLNRYFAKLAWAWTTALFLGAVAAASRHRSPAATLRHLTRYALATLYWVVMTQWFFGPPLFDRLFLHTGGVCMLPPPPHAQPPAVSTNSLKSCRSAGGSWVGGHDISGHCFLLLHSALFLVEEVLTPLLSSSSAPLSSTRHTTNAGPPPGTTPTLAKAAAAIHWIVVAGTVGLICIWALMLYFTAKYFHGIEELVTGTLLGVGYWAPLYQFAQLLV
ncbi:hypothetical protein GGI25_003686 [Coemansia spiralis]|uniref:Inositol phospholipid synthesis and fat-storage-inducing TM-domain-containing protein n=2 Tax=Coemansia TaxID=4863 RepID=A0A9W8G5X8_9FUNG|nr:hypothetical protein EDC05_003134 [Coemansia umbellata]KAJ2676180.1 hypothetical protein GGI25_003686 [Coemansia spiralis]